MSFQQIQKIPLAQEILAEIPLPDDLRQIKANRDIEISDIFTGKSNKFLLIIGPCSAHDEHAVYEYCEKLAKLQEKVQERLILIPRIYTNKPRTTGEGYKGMAHQPDLSKKPDIVEGMKAIRKMHLKVLKDTHLTSADEMLYPENYPYLEDLLSYVAVGARSVENQQHRLTCSGVDVPVGMKNPTSGDLEVMLNSINATQKQHIFFYNGWEVETTGNPLAHAILRGAVNSYNTCIPNYHYEDLIRLTEKYLNRNLSNPAIVIDTNHANSNKCYDQQPRIAQEVLYVKKHNSILNNIIKGLMIESFLVEGSQKATENVYGKSITDPCIGWDDTEKLVFNCANS